MERVRDKGTRGRLDSTEFHPPILLAILWQRRFSAPMEQAIRAYRRRYKHYWKSNPYLSRTFTGEDDSCIRNGSFVDLAPFDINAVRILLEDRTRGAPRSYWAASTPCRTTRLWVTFWALAWHWRSDPLQLRGSIPHAIRI